MAAPILLSLYRGLARLAPFAFRLAARRAHSRQGAHPARLDERFGQSTRPRPEGPLIWLHAESVGEVNAISGLAQALAPKAHLLITTTTATGAARVEALGLRALTHQFKPVDTPAATRRFLAHWQPDIALFAENDMPPTLLGALTQQSIPKALIAARPSKTRARAPKTAAALLAEFDLITASSEPVAQEIEALGLPVATTEDIKAQHRANATPLSWAEDQRARPLWLAVSTHPEDHALVFEAHDLILQAEPRALLAIAPRHPQPSRAWASARFAPVFFSDGLAPRAETQLFVMDAFGHLPQLHAMSHVCYIGGALARRGGHSPWEAARAGAHIMTGPNTANNAPAYAQIPHQTVEAPEALAAAVLAAWVAPRPAPIQPSADGSATLDAVLALLEGAR